jgi:4-hydroxy-tetrahydrodipicolinate synthase
VYAASITPLDEAGKPDLKATPEYLAFLAERGCHGALILGTTGEGPSFSPEERVAIWEAAISVRESFPAFRLFAGTGTPSLPETISLNKAAFNLGFDAVVVLPPFYYRNADDDGLFDWYTQVIDASVPEGKQLLGYHIPAVSGVNLSLELLKRLNSAAPDKFAGLKDSSGDIEHAQMLITNLESKLILVGHDKLLADALKAGASGCITALANLQSPLLRAIWDAYQVAEDTDELQESLNAGRTVLDSYPPAPAFLKAMLHEMHGFPNWTVRAPLRGLDKQQAQEALVSLQDIQK